LKTGCSFKLTLCSSERISLSGVEGDRLQETQNINLALTALGDVLSALSKNTMLLQQQAKCSKSNTNPQLNLKPVPYRNSKLTYLLKVIMQNNETEA
jgi:hypothetical protein